MTAVASIGDNRSTFTGKHVPRAAVYADAEEMMYGENEIIVDVFSPMPVHCPLIEAAAERGLDVFCEKPISWPLDGADSIVAMVEQTGSNS